MEKTVYLNFKSLKLIAPTKQEAFDSAPFRVDWDATQAYRNWVKKQSVVTPSAERDFMLEYLTKKTKNAPGVGCYITIKSAVADTRERPYKIDDVKNEKGKRKYSTIYTIKNADTNKIIAKCDETKAKAKEMTKELYKKGFKGNIVCEYNKEVSEGEKIAFRASYAPSKNTTKGEYIVFGIEA